MSSSLINRSTNINTEQPKRLIEVTLPLASISEQSAREKSIRHGHISTLHIWWARRPLAAMRAAIFASLIPDPGTPEERKKLEELIAIIVNWDQVKDGNSPKIEEAKELIRRAFPDRPPRLLDPFMGGGATGLEALRLGCETHAVELNPVAHLIELCTLVYPQKYGRPQPLTVRDTGPQQLRLPGEELPEQMPLELTLPAATEGNPLAADVRKWGQWVLERARGEIGHLYANPEGKETIVGYLWARTVRCPNPACRVEMPLVRQWWLANTGSRKLAMRPLVDVTAKHVGVKVVDTSTLATNQFDPSEGTTGEGSAVCLVCGQAASGDYLQQMGMEGRLGQRLLAVVFEQPGAQKGYRQATAGDVQCFVNADHRLREWQTQKPGLLPDEPVDPNRPSASARGLSAVTRYGVRSFGDLFNRRQLLALATFSQLVGSAHAEMITAGVQVDRAKAICTYL
ncbi:MAG: DUF1156 domain-containing protein, partial [Polyangiaceae bacterium]|nr:DUF1156 domain-containing protein [Polyangiaceae bacterium]